MCILRNPDTKLKIHGRRDQLLHPFFKCPSLKYPPPKYPAFKHPFPDRLHLDFSLS